MTFSQRLRKRALFLLMAPALVLGPADCPISPITRLDAHASRNVIEIGEVAVVRIELEATEALREVVARNLIVQSVRPQVAAIQGDLIPVSGTTGQPTGGVFWKHVFDVTIVGKAFGFTDIIISEGGDHFRLARSVGITLTVEFVEFRLDIRPSSLTLVPGQQAQLTCVATSIRTGQPVPMDVFWASFDFAASVDNNGLVRAERVGQADIECSAGGERATARVTVRTPETPPAPVAGIPGAYFLAASLVTNNCVAGSVPPAINRAVSVQTIVSPGVTTISTMLDFVVQGTYDVATGAWTASGQGGRTYNNGDVLLVERIDGKWGTGPPINMTGTLTMEYRDAHGVVLCRATYEAALTRP